MNKTRSFMLGAGGAFIAFNWSAFYFFHFRSLLFCRPICFRLRSESRLKSIILAENVLCTHRYTANTATHVHTRTPRTRRPCKLVNCIESALHLTRSVQRSEQSAYAYYIPICKMPCSVEWKPILWSNSKILIKIAMSIGTTNRIVFVM